MTTIVTRAGKGSPLTNTEVDNNFSNLNTAKLELGQAQASATANSLLYFNGSKLPTTSTALTFDGTSLAVAGKVTAAGAVLSAFAAGTAGGNLELGWDGVQSVVQSYNRTTSAYVPLWLESSYARFGISGSEAMRLTSTGLGIGTSSPSTKLTVHAGADGDVGFFRGGSFRQVQIGTSSTAGYINTDNGSAGLELRTQGTARAYLDNSGNLGLGTAPSSGGSIYYKSFELGKAGCGLFAATNSLTVSELTYLTGNAVVTYSAGPLWTRGSNGPAATYGLEDGIHKWFIGPDGTAGTTISFTQAMTLTAAGDLLVGATSATAFGKSVVVNASTTAGTLYQVSGADKAGMYVDTSTTYLFSNTSPMLFSVNGAERARITSGGNLLIGTTTNQGSSVGGIRMGDVCALSQDINSFYINGNVQGDVGGIALKTGNYALQLAIDTSAGAYIFRSTAGQATAGNAVTFTERARITPSGSLLVGTTSESGRVAIGGNGSFTALSLVGASSVSDVIRFADVDIGGQGFGGSFFEWTRGGSYDNTLNLYIRSSSNVTANRFQFQNDGNAYKSSGAGSWLALSDIRVKTNIAVVSGGLDRIMQLRPVTFDYKSPAAHQDKEHDKGFIADDFMQVYPDSVYECNFVHDADKQYFEAGEKAKALGFNAEFYADLVAAIQELKAEFDAYKATHP